MKPRLLFASWLSFAAFVFTPTLATAVEGTTKLFPAVNGETARLSIHGAADLQAMEPLIRDFQEISPDITIDYSDYVTNELHRKASAACEQNTSLGDLWLSSSLDQLVSLANNGCASAYSSSETAQVPKWANWRDEVFGFTFEPAVFVYNARYVPSSDVPRTRAELADLLRRRLDYYEGRVGTFDIRTSGVGYLLAFSDARQATATYGRLLESMSRADVKVSCCTGTILQEIASGRIYLAYNMIGSYSYAAAQANPDLRVVIPRDYALILSRGVLIPKTARRPDLARRFLDYLLSKRGQDLARRKAFFFAEKGNIPEGVDGPSTLGELSFVQPIRIGPALLAAQDEAQRRRFIDDWSHSMLSNPGSPPPGTGKP
ncbi:ABC transporter substrate-binding protein [Rhizobium sp. CNPSo 4062]|uniref:ABC transporter substrate-binding protein n=1 Tax=Rhizobium sp. CNPSo 4062 TaxID=3021410 RepID=UPI000DDD5D74|nr:ABC transporter substrate-binding protein [Rhizobium sp. CNPSo 4062]MDK4705944.1 ABC transporter substrate-binding protein [Rhizobium sp. CNPSo 4062]